MNQSNGKSMEHHVFFGRKISPKITVEFFYCGHVTGRKLVKVIVVNPLYIRPLFPAKAE